VSKAAGSLFDDIDGGKRYEEVWKCSAFAVVYSIHEAGEARIVGERILSMARGLGLLARHSHWFHFGLGYGSDECGRPWGESDSGELGDKPGIQRHDQ
jgi:hypothetical protein